MSYLHATPSRCLDLRVTQADQPLKLLGRGPSSPSLFPVLLLVVVRVIGATVGSLKDGTFVTLLSRVLSSSWWSERSRVYVSLYS